MKTLLLLRHAKSNWDADYASDHERPLSKRGRSAASLMGEFLTMSDLVPDRVVSSTAIRAHKTALLAAKAGRWSCPIDTTGRLYEASPEDVLEVVRGCDDSDNQLLLAGHEPTWSESTGRLVGHAHVKFTTATLARIDFSMESWKQADFGRGTLVWLVTPKLLGKIGWTGQGRGPT